MKKSKCHSRIGIIILSSLAFLLGCTTTLKYSSVNPGIARFKPMEKVIVPEFFISTYSDRYRADLEMISKCCIKRFEEKGQFAVTRSRDAFLLLKEKSLEKGYEKFFSKLLIFNMLDQEYLQEVANTLDFDGMLVGVLTVTRVFGVKDNDVELKLYLIDFHNKEIIWKSSSTIVIGKDLNLEGTENRLSDLERLISVVDKLPQRLRLKKKR